MLFIIRQIVILVVVVAFFLSAILIVTPYFKATGRATVTFKDKDGKRAQLTGEVTKKEKYVTIKPDEGGAGGEGAEQDIPWDQVELIAGQSSRNAEKISDVSDLLELIAKLGVLAAALVFLFGLYQYEVGQKWKREEFLAGTVNDFGGRTSVENAKKMIELLMFYPQGRKLRLYPDAPDAEQSVRVENILSALDPDATYLLTDDEKQIRECFDAFFSRLERFEHYIESKLVEEDSVYIYLNYWINILMGRETVQGKGAMLDQNHLAALMGYVEYYEFPKIDDLLERYKDRRWRTRARRWVRYRLPKRKYVAGKASPAPGRHSSAGAGRS